MFLSIGATALLILLPIIVSAITVIVRACTLPRGMQPAPVCGACGYLYSGWTRCPECGGELLTVGLLTPRLALKLRGSLVVAVIAMLVLLFIAGSLSGAMGYLVFSSMGYTSVSGTSTFIPASLPVPVYTIEATIDLEHDSSGLPVRGGLEFKLIRKAISSRVEVDAVTGCCRVFDSTDTLIIERKSFDEIASAKLFEAAKLDIGERLVAQSAGDLVAISHDIRTRGWKPGAAAPIQGSAPPGTLQQGNSIANMGSATPVRIPGFSSGASWWVLVWAFTLASGVLLFGVVFRRRARLLRPTSPPLPPPAPPSPQAATIPPPDSSAAGRS